jgi:hypothetical protein
MYTYLPPKAFNARRDAGEDMTWYRKSRPIPIRKAAQWAKPYCLNPAWQDPPDGPPGRLLTWVDWQTSLKPDVR